MRLLFNEHPIIASRELAVMIGLNKSIVLQQIMYWINHNKEKGINFKDGRYWTYKSITSWQTHYFPFFSISTLKRIFKSLVDSNLLLAERFNKDKRDQTNWYSINEEKLEEIYHI